MAADEYTDGNIRSGEGTRHRYLASRYDALTEFFSHFEPGDRFTEADVPDYLFNRFKEFRGRNIVVKSGTRLAEHRDVEHVAYLVDRRAYEWIQNYSPHSPEMPCGHHGISVLPENQYSCTEEWCDEVYNRQQVEVLWESKKRTQRTEARR